MIDEKPITMADVEALCQDIREGRINRTAISKMTMKCFDAKGRLCKDPYERHMEMVDRIIRSL